MPSPVQISNKITDNILTASITLANGAQGDLIGGTISVVVSEAE